jgi:flagellar protein FlgJ
MSNVIPLKQFKQVAPDNTQASQERKMREAAEMFEGQFLDQMVKSMRSTVDHSELTEPSMAEGIYNNQLDQEYVKSWVGRGGVGLADLIVDQLREKFGMAGRPSPRPAGPIPLEQKQNFKMQKVDETDRKLEFKVETVKGDKVSSLWNGIIESSFKTDGGKSVIQVGHDNGLKSRLVFNGPSALKQFDSVRAGEALGSTMNGEIALQIFS